MFTLWAFDFPRPDRNPVEHTACQRFQTTEPPIGPVTVAITVNIMDIHRVWPRISQRRGKTVEVIDNDIRIFETRTVIVLPP